MNILIYQVDFNMIFVNMSLTFFLSPPFVDDIHTCMLWAENILDQAHSL